MQFKQFIDNIAVGEDTFNKFHVKGRVKKVQFKQFIFYIFHY